MLVVLLYALIVVIVANCVQPIKGNQEQNLLSYVLQHGKQNDAESVWKAMDDFRLENQLPAGCDVKAIIIEEEIVERKPEVIVEIGGNCAYNAVRFAPLQRQRASNAKYICYECSHQSTDIALEIVSYAGLSDVVDLRAGAFTEIFTQPDDCKVDMFIIDHSKAGDLSNIETIIDRQALNNGSVIIASNVIASGYKEFMENRSDFKNVITNTDSEHAVEQQNAIMISKYIV